MRYRVLATAMFLAILITSCFSGTQAEAQATAPVEVGKAYNVFFGVGALRFKVLEIGKGGLVKVQAVEDGSSVGIENGSTWWLNLNQTLLVEAIK